MSKHFSPDMFDVVAPRGTRWYVLDGIRVRSTDDVRLELRPAGDANPDYMNARRKLDNAVAAHAGSGRLRDESTRRDLIPLFAKTVVAGWDNVLGVDGKAVVATPDEIEAFLGALNVKNGDLVERVMLYAINQDNFREPMGSAEALGNG